MRKKCWELKKKFEFVSFGQHWPRLLKHTPSLNSGLADEWFSLRIIDKTSFEFKTCGKPALKERQNNTISVSRRYCLQSQNTKDPTSASLLWPLGMTNKFHKIFVPCVEWPFVNCKYETFGNSESFCSCSICFGSPNCTRILRTNC